MGSLTWITTFLVVALASSGWALYSASDPVVELTDSNFERLVVKSDEIWVVEFYAPWCGHCQQLAPEYKKAASALKGVVKVGGVNCGEQSVYGQCEVRGFPTIKIFGDQQAIVGELQLRAERGQRHCRVGAG